MRVCEAPGFLDRLLSGLGQRTTYQEKQEVAEPEWEGQSYGTEQRPLVSYGETMIDSIETMHSSTHLSWVLRLSIVSPSSTLIARNPYPIPLLL